MINASVVLYNTSAEDLEKAIYSLTRSSLLHELYLIDNSERVSVSDALLRDSRIRYIHTGKNLGYGRAHNIALRRSLADAEKRGVPRYHLVMNPDVYFSGEVLERLYSFMESNPDVGLVMPKVLFPDGRVQYLCKLLPTPFELFRRRFLSFLREFNERRDEIFELRFTGYDKPMEVPYLSGCFMFLRVEALRTVGLFDERFFLYFDDLDLSRRIFQKFRCVYYPGVQIYHVWKRGSYHSKRLLFYHILDALRYFLKWGFFRDRERREINERILRALACRGLCERSLPFSSSAGQGAPLRTLQPRVNLFSDEERDSLVLHRDRRIR